jgi:hypothetical protein
MRHRRRDFLHPRVSQRRRDGAGATPATASPRSRWSRSSSEPLVAQCWIAAVIAAIPVIVLVELVPNTISATKFIASW